MYETKIEGWNISQPLHLAAQAGDLETVVRLVREQPSLVHFRDGWYQETPLHKAKTGLVALLLLQFGADIDALDQFGSTPLHSVEESEVAHMLIKQGANVHAANDQRRSVLQAWVGRDNLEIVRMLVARGADLHVMLDGKALLHSAQSVEMAEFLIEHGISIETYETEHDDFSTPLMLAARRGLSEVVALFLCLGADLHASSPYFGSAFVQALREGQLNVAAMLLEAGADVNGSGWDGNSPLHETAKHAVVHAAGRRKTLEGVMPVEMAHLLVEHGADLCARNRFGEMPIHIAREGDATDLTVPSPLCGLF